jgi:mRNA interferase RelE/StbE
MAEYRIEFTPSAYRAFAKLDQQIRQRLEPAISALAREPRPRDCKRLTANGNLLRIRVGAYRVVYFVEDDILLVLVIKLGHRRDVYREL